MNAFDTIIGYEEEKKEFMRLVDIMQNHGKYKALGVTTPKGLLLVGDPGLGKTTMAKAIIGSIALHQYRRMDENGKKRYVKRIAQLNS